MNSKKIINIVTTYYYTVYDDEELLSEPSGDYSGIEVSFILQETSKVLYSFSFGDYYHDKGEEKVEAAIEVFKTLLPAYEYTEEIKSINKLS